MAEPPIQFVKTKDGVTIAFWAAGTGDPLVWIEHVPMSHLEAEWQMPYFAKPHRAAMASRTVARFDPRGCGLSERGHFDYSLKTQLIDLQAVVHQLGIDRFAIWGDGLGSRAAMAWAATYPETVTHLLLEHPIRNFRKVVEEFAQGRALRSLVELDWDMHTEAWGGVTFGWSDAEAHSYGEFARKAVTQGTATHFFADAMNDDIEDSISRIRCPTLVIAHEMFNNQGYTSIAADIPGARMITVRGTRTEGRLDALEQALAFMGSPAAILAKQGRDRSQATGTAVILFADIADSTALTERLGDAAFRERARDLDGALRQTIVSNGGTAVDGKLLGDGVLATFASAREAISCASALHALAGSGVRGQGLSHDKALLLHIGIHAGDVIREDGNVFGGTVNIASRVAGEAGASETFVSQTVRDLARTSAGVSFEDRGERELKGIAEPVRIFLVREQRG